MDKTILPIIQSVAQKIVDDEHSFFIEDSLDNSEHIPRIKRIANSVNKFLKDHGVSKKDCDLIYNSIIEHGRKLFIEEWMKPIEGDDEPLNEEEAIEAFNERIRIDRESKANHDLIRLLNKPGSGCVDCI